MQYQYGVLDGDSDFSGYKCLILPDEVAVDDALKGKLVDYVKRGGSVVLSHQSGLDSEGRWALGEIMPLAHKGEHPDKPYYARPAAALAETLPDTDHVMYLGGSLVEAGEDTEIAATITRPYFNREWNHFCSHLQTPPMPPAEDDAPELLIHGRCAYFASPLFHCYQDFAPAAGRTMLSHVLERFVSEKLLKTNLPSTAETTMRKAPTGETVLTLIHYIPQRRTPAIDIVEDEIPLFDTEIDLLAPGASSVKDGETGEVLDFRREGDRIRFTVDRISGYRVLVIE